MLREFCLIWYSLCLTDRNRKNSWWQYQTESDIQTTRNQFIVVIVFGFFRVLMLNAKANDKRGKTKSFRIARNDEKNEIIYIQYIATMSNALKLLDVLFSSDSFIHCVFSMTWSKSTDERQWDLSNRNCLDTVDSYL